MFYNKLLTLRGPCLTEASPLICRENQWTGFYMIGTSAAKRLRLFLRVRCLKITLLLCLQEKTLLMWQPAMFLTNSYLFLSSIYSLQYKCNYKSQFFLKKLYKLYLTKCFFHVQVPYPLHQIKI